MRLLLTTTILFFLLHHNLNAQQSNEYQLLQFNTENGLPSNGIKGIQWEKETGLLWIATEAGIVRYNGLEFKNYSYEDDPHISNDRMLFIVKNNKGKIYTTDFSGKVYSVEKNRIKYLFQEKISGNPNSNLFTLNVSEILKNASFENPSRNPFGIQFDRIVPLDDTTTFIIHYGEVYKYSISQRKPITLFNDGKDFINGFKSNEGYFLCSATNELFKYDINEQHLIPIRIIARQDGHQFNLSEIKIIWENGMQQPVIFEKQKAWVINFENGKLVADLIADKVPADILIRYAQYDAEKKILFIGTDSRGIFIIKQNKVQSLRSGIKGISERTSYYAQLELPDGNILTNEGHVLGQNKTDFNSLPIKGKFSPTVYRDADSIIWYDKFSQELQLSCLHKLDTRTGKTTIFKKVRTNLQSAYFTIDHEFYIANGSGIWKLQGDSLLNIYKNQQPNAGTFYFDACPIDNDKIALATCNALLSFDLLKNKMDTILTTSNYCVRTLWKYNDYLFAGTYGDGIYILKDGVIKKAPIDKNKFLQFTHCFINDENGFCWISTNKGLFKASINEMIDAYENNTPAIYYHYFGKNDGMEMTELNGGCIPCAIVLKNKTISFPSMDGLLWADPVAIKPALPDGVIYIDNIVVDSLMINEEDLPNIDLPAKTREVTINFVVAAWCNKENIYLEYQVNDSLNWKPIDAKNMAIHLNNPGQGDFFVRIRKLNGFGINNYTYKTINFTIKTPWYKTWWFNLSVFFLILGLISLYVRIRTRQLKNNQARLEKLIAEKTKELQLKNEVLEKNDSIKTRLISIISHDIVTPLKFLTAAGKNLIEKRNGMPDELQRETLYEMVNTSQELQFLSTNILNWIKFQNENRRITKERINFYEMVMQVFSILNSLAKQKGIKLINATDPKFIIYQFAEPIKILVYNLVTNSINFSQQRTITVGTKSQNDTTIIYVKDEGAGMTPEHVQNILADEIIITASSIDKRKGHGLGYLIIKDLLKMMNASIEINSEKGKGTIVFIKMKNETK